MARVTLSPATSADFAELAARSPNTPPLPKVQTIAIAGKVDGRVIAIGGVCFLPNGQRHAFADIGDEARKFPIALHKAALATIALAKQYRVKRLTAVAAELKRYSIEYQKNGDAFEIIVPPLRLDLAIEEDMAEEVARIIGYDKIKPEMPKIHFRPRMNEIIQKINLAYNKLLGDGYTEVMTYVFRDEGVVEVLESALDKKLLRTNLTDGLKESMKLNQANAALLDLKEVKIFEIGTIFKKRANRYMLLCQ